MAYADEVLADGPLAYYRMGETPAMGTTMFDASGNSRNGTYGNEFGIASRPGLLVNDPDPCSFFDSSQYAVVPNAAWMAVSAITAEAIIQPDPVTGDRVLMARDQSGTTGPWRLRISSSKIQWLVWKPGLQVLTGATTLVAGQTYHVAATYDGANMRIYLNGVQDASAAGTGTMPDTGRPLNVGRYESGEVYRGLIDEVAFYGTALSSARIATHYAVATSVPAPTHSLTLAAVAPAATASFDLSRTLPARDITLAGTAPAASAAFVLEHAEPPPPVNEVAFSATAPPAVGSLDLAHLSPIDLTFAAIAPAATASFLLAVPSTEPTITFAAVAPAAVAAFTLLGPLTTTTDLTSDVSEGYNYDGESDVLDDGSTGSIPAGIILAPIRFVHQSVPAPVLVKGRPV